MAGIPRLNIEQATRLLKATPGVPRKFRVDAVAYIPDLDAYAVRWFDESQLEKYEDAVGTTGPDAAKAAYAMKPGEYRFSAVFFNEKAEGVFAPAVENLSDDDVLSYAAGGRVQVVDAAPGFSPA